MKHYDNKNNLIAEMRRAKAQAQHASAQTFTVYMELALLTLYEDLGFRDKRLKDFVKGVEARSDKFGDGKLTEPEMRKRLLDEAGVYVEPPNISEVKL